MSPRRASVLLALLLSTPLIAPADEPPPPPIYDPEHACVVTSTDGGRVTIQSRFSVRVGDRFALVPVDSSEAVVSIRGVFAVDRALGDTASGELPRGVYAMPGDRAVPTTLPTRARLLAPRQHRPLLRARALLRPTLTVSNERKGFALLGDVSADYDFRFPLTLGVAAAPVGVVTNEDGTSGFGRLFGRLGYGGDYFGIGVLVGADLHSGDAGAGAVAGVWLRAGTLDGLHLTTAVSLVFGGGGGEGGTRFGAFEAEGEVPMHRRVSLYAAGGVASQWSHAHLGFKSFVRGNGLGGTVLLYTAFGFARVREVDTFNFGVDGYGPSLMLGMELRR